MSAIAKDRRAAVGMLTWIFAVVGVLMIPVTVFCAERFGSMPLGPSGDTSGIGTVYLIYPLGFAFTPLFFGLAGLAHAIRACVHERQFVVTAVLAVIALLVVALIAGVGYLFVLFCQP